MLANPSPKGIFETLTEEARKIFQDVIRFFIQIFWEIPLGRLFTVSLGLLLAVNFLVGPFIVAVLSGMAHGIGLQLQVNSLHRPWFNLGIWFLLEIPVLRAFARVGHGRSARILEGCCIGGLILCFGIVPNITTYFATTPSSVSTSNIAQGSTHALSNQMMSVTMTPACNGVEQPLNLKPHQMSKVINLAGHCNLHIDVAEGTPFCFVDLQNKTTCVADGGKTARIKPGAHFQKILAENMPLIGGYALLPPSP